MQLCVNLFLKKKQSSVFMREKLNNLLAVFIGLLFTAVLLEVVLHFYNPLPTRVKGNKIVLKTNFKRVTEINPPVAGLEEKVNYATNGIGFRGDEKPVNYDQCLTIFTVGGSTTESSLISNDKTWTALTGEKLKKDFNSVWINNAGIDGCSSYGHNILLDDYLLKLKPKVILFMVGINDRGVASFEKETGFLQNQKESFLRRLIKKSELINLCNTIYMRYKAQKVNIGYNTTDHFKNHPAETQAQIDAKLKTHLQYQPNYQKRLEALATKCKNNNILPIFISQTLIDPDFTSEWQVMQLYNTTTMQVAQKEQIPFINLAANFEKRPEYFMDQMHFTLAGSANVADVIYPDLKTILKEKFAGFVK
jgi:lysophospholipase L1-like esterase